MTGPGRAFGRPSRSSRRHGLPSARPVQARPFRRKPTMPSGRPFHRVDNRPRLWSLDKRPIGLSRSSTASSGRTRRARRRRPALIEGAAFIWPRTAIRSWERKSTRARALIAPRREGPTDPEKAVSSAAFLRGRGGLFPRHGQAPDAGGGHRYADQMDTAYGPGKKSYISGHERLRSDSSPSSGRTGDARYWKLASFFSTSGAGLPLRSPGLERGRRLRPGRKAGRRTGRSGRATAVRATYLYIPLTDVAALTGEASYLNADRKIWEDVAARKMYLTGGIGAIRFHEQFGAAYELPNVSAWNETCASYGNIVWNHLSSSSTGIEAHRCLERVPLQDSSSESP